MELSFPIPGVQPNTPQFDGWPTLAAPQAPWPGGKRAVAGKERGKWSEVACRGAPGGGLSGSRPPSRPPLGLAGPEGVLRGHPVATPRPLLDLAGPDGVLRGHPAATLEVRGS